MHGDACLSTSRDRHHCNEAMGTKLNGTVKE